MKIDKAITIAKEAALNSNAKFRIGSCLFSNNTYTFGFNRNFGVKNMSRQKPFSIHAEEMAIIKANRIDFDFKNSTLVVVRINRGGNLMNVTPCSFCQGLIDRFEIKTVYCSIGDKNDVYTR